MQYLYDSIGVNFNSTRCADPFLAGRLLSLMSPSKDGRCLDVGCGTGNYTKALAAGGYSFYGVEPSKTMLKAASQNGFDLIKWTQAAAEALPFENEVFGAAAASLTIHHWKSLEIGFAEIYRVLKTESNFVIFTSFPEQMENYWLNYYFPKMLKDSIAVMPTRQKVEKALNFAGFEISKQEKYFIRPDLQDLFLYCGKHRPSLYFSESVRNGISSFSALSNAEEVRIGLRKLSEDLENGRFSEIAEKFESDSGDYIFMTARKV